MLFVSKNVSLFRVNEIHKQAWDQIWPKVNFSNLLQSWEYGSAKADAEGWRPLRLLVTSELGEQVALAQVLTKTWPIIGGVARLNRGPLLISKLLTDPERQECIRQSLDAILQECCRRKLRLIFVSPEIEQSRDYDNDLAGNKILKISKKIPYSSSRLSLQEPMDEVFRNLNGKWRNMLRKSQKIPVRVEQKVISSELIENLLKKYQEMQISKGFKGVSEKLLRSMSKQVGQDWSFNLYQSNFLGDTSSDLSGYLVSVKHGDTTTYLIGYTNEIGKRTNSNYLLLWQSIEIAKSQGCRWYDLGGMNANTPKGVFHFKKGINAEYYTLNSQYKKYYI